ncbi:COBW domain-containing protein 1 [Hondaea fermentalgiana]|uniref:COBW domain-containing protein 1 n=1 Tax=Hondaea fermentalgiana TaxID=2315210 RepID=A0A2R5GFB2_9STRA|nr:COBW domain-containing protein 1 [Hondaea fermentalgiana]|eukprot:GBG27313.1 COBW domain-containing protein 1 [Hondaea fermentalgiana]
MAAMANANADAATAKTGTTEEQEPGTRRTPVTILTGLLGAGKTTLLRGLLNGDHGRRLAVIENEFGDEKGIERLIARDQEGASVDLEDLFVELSNGCVCCAVKDDLVTTLEGLLERSNKFDQIVVETTGVADPGPLAGIFWLDEALESRIFLDGIVAVADAKNLHRHVDDPRKQAGSGVVNEAVKQLGYADRIVLNKTDLVDEEGLEAARSRVKEINALAQVHETSYSKVDPEFVLDVRGYTTISETSGHQLSALQRELLAQEPGQSAAVSEESGAAGSAAGGHKHEHEHDGECDASCESAHGRHDASITSCVVRVGSLGLNQAKLESWLGKMLWEPSGGVEIFRVKGIVNIASSDHVHILQGVHETFEIDASQEAWGSKTFPERDTRIVFIGRNLDVAALTTGLREEAAE